jgi:hypothetical protein
MQQMQPTLGQLKIAAYDTLAQIERFQKQLQNINEAIANYRELPEENKDTEKAVEMENKKPTVAQVQPEAKKTV